MNLTLAIRSFQSWTKRVLFPSYLHFLSILVDALLQAYPYAICSFVSLQGLGARVDESMCQLFCTIRLTILLQFNTIYILNVTITLIFDIIS